MTYQTRLASSHDVEFLWEMLFYASHSDEDAGVSGPQELKSLPELARYVTGFGAPTDLGVIALAADSGELAGAAWFRLLTGDQRGYGWVNDLSPELAIATGPAHRGRGAGRRMLERLLPLALEHHEMVSLSCRMQNPARRLYERMGFELVPGSEKPNRVGGTSGVMTLTRARWRSLASY